MNLPPKRLLLVEGDEDKRVLPWLIERVGRVSPRAFLGCLLKSP
jgi:hypothetical protein